MVVMITVYAGVSVWMCACVAGYVLVCISADLTCNYFLCKMFPPVMMEILTPNYVKLLFKHWFCPFMLLILIILFVFICATLSL